MSSCYYFFFILSVKWPADFQSGYLWTLIKLLISKITFFDNNNLFRFLSKQLIHFEAEVKQPFAFLTLTCKKGEQIENKKERLKNE